MNLMTLSDGSSWVRIFYHNCNNGTVLFTSVNEVLNTQTANKYSRLYLLDSFKSKTGKFEFMLRYPEISTTAYNRWRQTNSPCKEFITQTSDGAGVATGYEPISIAWSGNYWGGLTLHNYNGSIAQCYISGSVGHSNWYYAIGASESWSEKMPGPNSAVSNKVELWVRLDTVELSSFKIFNDKTETREIIEI